MRQDFKKLFIRLESVEPPAGLFGKIMSRVEREKTLLSVRRRLFLFSVGLFVSAAAIFPAFKMVQNGFAGSGFVEFFSLLFSDAGFVAVYWKNFLFSLLETLPVTGLMFLSAAILAFLEFVKLLAKNIGLVVGHKHINNLLIK